MSPVSQEDEAGFVKLQDAGQQRAADFSLADELRYSANLTQIAIGILRAAIFLMGFLVALVSLNFKFHILASYTIVPTMIALISIISAILAFCGIIEGKGLAENIQKYLSLSLQTTSERDHVTLEVFFARDRFRRRGYINRAALLLMSSLLLALSIVILLLAERFEWESWWNSLSFSLETVLPFIAFAAPVLILIIWEVSRWGKHS